jgi:hypothetical protein
MKKKSKYQVHDEKTMKKLNKGFGVKQNWNKKLFSYKTKRERGATVLVPIANTLT